MGTYSVMERATDIINKMRELERKLGNIECAIEDNNDPQLTVKHQHLTETFADLTAELRTIFRDHDM